VKTFLTYFAFILALAVAVQSPVLAQDDDVIRIEATDLGYDAQDQLLAQNIDETAQPSVAPAGEAPLWLQADDEEPASWLDRFWAWLKENWAEAVLGALFIIETVVNLTPTEKDNAWFRWLRDLIQSIIPNRAKGGGTHPSA